MPPFSYHWFTTTKKQSGILVHKVRCRRAVSTLRAARLRFARRNDAKTLPPASGAQDFHALRDYARAVAVFSSVPADLH